MGLPSSVRAEDTELSQARPGQASPVGWGRWLGLPGGSALRTSVGDSLVQPAGSLGALALTGVSSPGVRPAPRCSHPARGRPLPASVLLPAWRPGCRPHQPCVRATPAGEASGPGLPFGDWFGRSWIHPCWAHRQEVGAPSGAWRAGGLFLLCPHPPPGGQERQGDPERCGMTRLLAHLLPSSRAQLRADGAQELTAVGSNPLQGRRSRRTRGRGQKHQR